MIARYFAVIAEGAGLACIVHIFPEHGEPPWGYWDDYLRPMHDLLSRSQSRLYAYAPTPGRAGGHRGPAKERLDEVAGLYRYHGIARGGSESHVVGQASVVLPPYREPYCHGRPVLEVFQGTRIVSESASWGAEQVRPEDRAGRTVVVVIDVHRGETMP